MTVQNGKLKELKNRLSDTEIDIFLCSASFEERCTSITENLDPEWVKSVIVATNTSFGDLVEDKRTLLTRRFQKAGVEVSDLPLDSNDPIKSGDAIVNIIGTVLSKTNPQRFLIDITTFTREALLMLVKYLKTVTKKGDEVEFIYAHAKEYSVGDSPEDKWLSKGIREVRSVLGFPGDLLPSRGNHLVMLVGFEHERALSLIRECEPSYLSLGLANEAERGTQPHQGTNVRTVQWLKSVLSTNYLDEFVFSAYDAEKTRDILRRQLEKIKEHNAIIAPMNTKISTLGAALLGLNDPSVQLCYALPNSYNYSRYSLPDDDYYMFRLSGFPH